MTHAPVRPVAPSPLASSPLASPSLARLAFAAVLLLALGHGARAQATGQVDIDLLSRADQIDIDGGLTSTQVAINQLGNRNEAEVEQRQLAGGANRARVVQRGDENVTRLLQSGDDNRVILIQNGSQNTYELDLEGSANDIRGVQRGDGNVVTQRLTNSRNVRAEYIQIGDENLIEHQADGLFSKDIKVLQEGDNMEVIIDQTTVVPVALPGG